MKSVNLVILIGRLTDDPETQTTPGDTIITNFSIAINRSWKDSKGEKHEEAEYYKITAFNKLAEICNKYLKKGRKVYVQGQLSPYKYTGKDGQKHKGIGITAKDINMLDSLPETEAEETAAVENVPTADPKAEAEYMEKVKDIA